MRYTFIMNLLFLLLVSCGNKVNKIQIKKFKHDTASYSYMKNGILHLDLKSAKENAVAINLSEICDSAIYIPLETTKKNLIQESEYILIDGNDLFYMYDWGCYHFNLEGKFLGQIGKVGRGPGELTCTSFFIDKADKKIYLYANYKRRLFKYSYSGELISMIKTGSLYGGLFYNNKQKKIFNLCPIECIHMHKPTKSELMFSVLNLKGNCIDSVKSKYFPHKFGIKISDVLLTVAFNKYYTYKDSVSYFQECSNDTLFEYKGTKMIPRLVMNNKTYKPKFKIDLFNEEYRLHRNQMYNWVRGESSRYIFISQAECYLYDKKLKKLQAVRVGKKWRYFKNDIDGIEDIYGISIINNKYLCVVNGASEVLERISIALKDPSCSIDVKRKLSDLQSKLNEDSNPVVILYRIRK
ncbi:6-bladed beta-propeller [Marinilabiliaceae bacterium JC040]|nr:6-bladed beta-propeller [Marinilabiliaceae bacterium JC040]